MLSIPLIRPPRHHLQKHLKKIQNSRIVLMWNLDIFQNLLANFYVILDIVVAITRYLIFTLARGESLCGQTCWLRRQDLVLGHDIGSVSLEDDSSRDSFPYLNGLGWWDDDWIEEFKHFLEEERSCLLVLESER